MSTTSAMVLLTLAALVLLLGLMGYETIAEYLHWWPTL